MRRNAALLITLILALPYANAQLGLNMSINPDHINLYHGEIGQVNASLSPASTVCSLNCDYELNLDGTTQAANIFEKNPSRTTRLGPIGVQAPPLTASNGRNGEQTYTLSVQCQERTRCGTNIQELNEEITVQYNLTPEQQSQYENLTKKIDEATTQLTTLQEIIDGLQAKLDDAPGNAVLQPVRSDLIELTNETRRFNETIQQARTNKEELQFRFGLQAFQPRFLHALNTTKDSLQRVEQRLDDRLNRHNNTAIQINNLLDRYDNYDDQAARLNVDDQTEQTRSSLQSLRDIFTNANFQAYQSIEQRIKEVNQSVQQLINTTGREAQTAETTTQQVIEQELNDTCTTSPTCNTTPPSTNGSIQRTLPQTCTYLQETLPSSYEEANTQRQQAYEANVERTNSLNERIQAVNEEITKLQPILDNITDITEENYVKTNTTQCRKSLDHLRSHDIPHVEDVKQAQEACGEALNNTKEASTTDQSMWTYMTYWVSDMFTSHTVTFDEPQQLDERQQPKRPATFKQSNTTKNFIQTYCDEPTLTPPPSPVSTLQ